MKTSTICLSLFAFGLCLPACEEASNPAQNGTSSGGMANAGDSPRLDDIPDSVPRLQFPVSADARSYVDLRGMRSVSADHADSTEWDLAFQGYEVFTNSGPSGPGQGAAFGPFSSVYFFAGEMPQGAPPLTPDASGGAFFGWYRYDGSSHALYSRYHVHAIRSGERLWKVQVLGYYGERNGGPVSALYSIRYAELENGSFGPTKTIQLDGTAGGAAAPDDAPSGCIDLRTGEQKALTVSQARQSDQWTLCARRDKISVNGGESGPLGAEAADLHEAESADETLDAIKNRTAESELARFEAVTSAQIQSANFRPDGVITSFRSLWIDTQHNPPQSGTGCWVVRGADGASTHLVVFPEFTGATAQTPNQITIASKKVSP